MSFEAELNPMGERLIWVEPAVVENLPARRGARESDSDLITRLDAIMGEGQKRQDFLSFLSALARRVQPARVMH